MDNMKHRRLQEMDRSDFEVADQHPDVRGWDVKDNRNQTLGEVEELIVDAQEKKVRYLVVDLKDNEVNLDKRTVLVPIGLAELDKDHDDVVLPTVTAQQIAQLPTYKEDQLFPETEAKICAALGRSSTPGVVYNDEEPEPEFYRHNYFNDDNLYKHRLHLHAASEYENGLRLWERRSEGGILPPETTRINDANAGTYHERTINDEDRAALIKNRREQYRQRKKTSGNHHHGTIPNKYRSVEDRIKEEGLRDADEPNR